jgi:hypothetical protein
VELKASAPSTDLIQELSKSIARDRLTAEGLADDEAVWSRLTDPEKGGLDGLAKRLGVSSEWLLETITSSTLRVAEEHEPNWLERHWFDGLIAVGVIVVLFLIVSMIARLVGSTTATQIVAARDLRAFEPIRRSDLQISSDKPQRHALISFDEAVDRYVTHEVTKGQVLRTGDVSAGRLPALTGRSLLRVAIKPAGTVGTWNLPIEVKLLVSPRQQSSAKPLVLPDVYLLAAQDSGDSTLTWIAVDANCLPELTAALASSDIFVAKKVR